MSENLTNNKNSPIVFAILSIDAHNQRIGTGWLSTNDLLLLGQSVPIPLDSTFF